MKFALRGALINSFRSIALFFLIFQPILATFFAVEVRADNAPISEQISKALSKQVRGSDLAYAVYDLQTGKEISSRNEDKQLKPASVQKLLTSYSALKLLGPDYKFVTQIFTRGRKGDHVDDLIIKGGGDPYLTTENIWLLARRVVKLGIKDVRRLVIDNSAFVDQPTRSGQRAYETAPSALTFNFNSLALEFCVGPQNGSAVITPEAWNVPVKITGQVKVSPTAKSAIQVEEIGNSKDSVAEFRVGGTLNQADGCKTVYRSINQAPRYFAEAFKKFLDLNNVQGQREISYSVTPSDATFVFAQESKALSEIVSDMNHFSTNFIAEQILYALGQNESGSFDRSRGVQRLSDVLKGLGFVEKEFVLIDGCGLSHDNRLSVKEIGKILLEVAKDEHLRPEFEVSLAVLGRSGTLRRRSVPSENVTVRGKTGSLDGVSSLAGYLQTKSGRRVAFVILQNNVGSKDEAVQIEDRFVEALSQG